MERIASQNESTISGHFRNLSNDLEGKPIISFKYLYFFKFCDSFFLNYQHHDDDKISI